MDHLPVPVDGHRPQISFEAEPRIYTPDDFVMLPSKYGYEDIDSLVENGLSSSMEPKLMNAFLQEWLYFALLARVVDQSIDANEFYCPRTRTVSTANFTIENKIENWKSRELSGKGLQCPKAQRRYRQSSDALNTVRRFVVNHLSCPPVGDHETGLDNRLEDSSTSKFGNRQAYKIVDSRLSLSIATLGEILQRESPQPTEARAADCAEFWWETGTKGWHWGYSRYCREQMQERGWCLGDIRRLESTMSGVCEVYYACSRVPRDVHDHSGCSLENCLAPPLDKLRHDPDCNSASCTDLGFDEREILKILSQDKTPLVNYSPTSGNLEVRGYDLEASPPSTFGAISHAWEDKILDIGSDARGGNSRRIFQCTLKRMQLDFNRIAQGSNNPTAVTENVPFYVDVLCYPRQVAAQTTALGQMRLIYSKASQVIVWDRVLLHTNKPSASRMIEMNIKLCLGNWAKSLWTLLEAVLPSHICVAFSDGTVSFVELNCARQEAKRDLYHEYHHIHRAGCPFNRAIYRLRKLKESKNVQFRPQQIWEAVQFHKIDRTENEALILAALMGLDLHDSALSVSPRYKDDTVEKQCERLASERMVKLLQLMNQTLGLGIPAGLIFLPSPKLRNKDIPGTQSFGWAPRSWLTRQAHPRSLRNPLRVTAHTHMNGLVVRFPGMIVHSPILPLEDRRFWIPVAHTMHKWFKVVAYPDVDDFTSWWRAVSADCELIIILSDPNPREQGAIGVLVKPKGTLSNGQIRWVDILCRVWIRLETDRNSINLLCQSFREYPERALYGTRLVEQDWCVDGMHTT